MSIFQDYEGESGDAQAGCEYFKKRFARLAQKANAKEREIYIQCVIPHRSHVPPPLRTLLLTCAPKRDNGNGYCHAAGSHGCCRRCVSVMFSH